MSAPSHRPPPPYQPRRAAPPPQSSAQQQQQQQQPPPYVPASRPPSSMQQQPQPPQPPSQKQHPQPSQQQQPHQAPMPLPPQAKAPKVILLVNPARENHGLVKQLGQMADVSKLSSQLDPADAVFSYRNRSIGLLTLSYPELRSHFARVLARVQAFHAKSSQHPMVVLISPRRDQTPPEWFALQEAAPLGRLSFLLATDLADATAGVGAALAVVKDDTRRQRQNEWFLELARAASSPGAAEGVLLGLWAALGLEEKELWRLLSVFGSVGRVASSNVEQLLQGCPIDRRTARILSDFLDGRTA